MTNKYLEKIARFGLAGAVIGGGVGAVAGGEDHRFSGALTGAALGGIGGTLIGKIKAPKPSAVANVFGKGRSTSKIKALASETNLAKKYGQKSI